jgi:uncharacterized OB-fold protein
MRYDVLPALTPFNRAWFTSGALAVQQCPSCRVFQHPPEELCHRCGTFDLETEVLAPTGHVHSYTVVHHAARPQLSDAVPYAVLLVALDQAPDVRVVADLVNGDPHGVYIGMPVEAVWTDHHLDGETIRLPHWRPADL